ncbi:lysozyme inhibitor LprI family protein [Legionella clemsonensis]|uniref:Lysozyme inhibitor LprI-like N-terminal domain-containing protein n=1 Tax=Legionella clemsonensis TaxID=1867846 RepID=A0A222P2I7_9GAMM|nr:lysozyme inhibitor LprI family protein [Legionella clemsonensis]ASQ46053.1 hypothetical protein clem_07500 [Legionella clemsonensis]
MDRKLGFLFLFLLLFSVASFAESNSLCQRNEQILFSCPTKNEKIISLCASENLSATTGYLQYRFGKKNNIELYYPEREIPPGKAFTGRSQMFSGGGGIYLRFSKNNYDYIIYSGIGKGWEINGLILLKNLTFLSYFPCTMHPISQISPEQLTTLNIPMDPANKEFFPGDIPQNKTETLRRFDLSSEELKKIQTCYENAVTTVAMKACAQSEYVFYNNLLNRRYNTLLNLLSQTNQNLLITTQKAWLDYRKKECDFEGLQNEGGTLESLSVIECYTKHNKERISELNEFIKIYQN